MSKQRFILGNNVGRALVILILGMCFYLYEYLVQVAPAVITTPLMRDFGLDAASFSTMVAFFYYAYSPMQLPGGLLYDRFGPRKVLSIFMGICVLGVFLFAFAKGYAMAAAGRFLMGVGGAVSFVGPLVLATRWFAAKYFAPIAGFLQFLGSIGGIVGQVFVSMLVTKFGWRNAMLQAAILGIVIVVLLALVVRDYPKGATIPKQKKIGIGEWHNLKLVFSKAQTIIIALYSFFAWFPITVFAALWGVSFVATKFHINTTDAAGLMACLWMGVALGSPVFGWWSERIMSRTWPLAFAGLIGLLAALVLLYVPLSLIAGGVCLFVIGVGTSGQSLSFAVIRDINSNSTVGTAMGFNNLAVVAGGAIGQPLVGWFIHLGWNGMVAGGVHVYDLRDYQHALLSIPLSFLLVFIFGKFFIKETHCKRLIKD